LHQHDPDYLTLYRQCLAETQRWPRIALYEQLVERTLAPFNQLWPAGTTAVYLKNPEEQPARVEEALTFWESLISDV
jgi:hypothetical protein